MDGKKICIVGVGGFGRETLVCLKDGIVDRGLKIDEVAVFMVSDRYYDKPMVMGVPVIKKSEFVAKKYKVVVAIGDPQQRKKMVESLPIETEFATIIHPSAIISEWVQIGEGTIITAKTILTCNIKVGKHTHLNLQTTIGHDCVLGDYLTTAPGVNISGGCDFGECVSLGTNSSVKNGVKICNQVTVGMGGVVLKDIDISGVYVGCPVKRINKSDA